jgi:flagellar biosynthesis protein FlhA
MRAVAILNLPLILEGIADFASLSKNPDDLSELVRRRLGIYFVPEFECRPGLLRGLTLDPRLEQLLISKIHRSATEVGLSLDPATARHFIEEINRRSAALTGEGLTAVLMVSAELRLPLRRFLEPSFPRVVVLAFQELPASTEIENAGIVTAPPAARAEAVILRVAEPAMVAA